MFGGQFGAAGAEVVIEEFMTGEEASFFVLCDGENVLPIGTAQDHKRVGDGDTGPNTGGMGAYSPAPVLTDALMERALDRIVRRPHGGRDEARRGHLSRRPLCRTDDRERGQARLVEYNVPLRRPQCSAGMLRLGAQTRWTCCWPALKVGWPMPASTGPTTTP